VAPCDLMTKDVRAANGWLIDIDIYENVRVNGALLDMFCDVL